MSVLVLSRVISQFCHSVNEILALLGFYIAYNPGRAKISSIIFKFMPTSPK